jgi:hypothetical protein
MSMKKMLIVVVCCLWSSMASGAMFSGGSVLSECKAFFAGKKPGTLVSGYCVGVVDTLLGLSVIEHQKLFCAPKGVSGTEAIDVVAEFMEMHPEESTGTFLILAIAAMSQKWPCR